MPRIRTVKPEFFEDEDIGLLSREARLLFIASWGLADDEGLLRWAVPFLKASVFMYDEDLDADEVETIMGELERAQMVFVYRGGKSQQRLAWIVNFRRHQVINRPQPGRLPPPSIQNPAVVAAYCRRDVWRCGICGEPIESDPVKRAGVHKLKPSLDHIEPRSRGGSDYPTNLRIAHQGCNASRGNRSEVEAVSDSVNDSLAEGNGREGKGKGESAATPADAPLSHLLADLVADNDPNGKRPTVTKRWADAERLLFERDNRQPGQAEALIRWSQRSEFWAPNIRSMPKFRAKYGQLWGQAKRDVGGGVRGAASVDDLNEQRRRIEAEQEAA